MGIREIVAKALGYKLGTPRGGFNSLIEMQTPPGWGYQSYLQAYGQVGWLFACVNVISNAVARQEWHLYELDKQDNRNELFTHPLLDLFDNLNPFQSRYQFMYLATMYKKLVGEEFWQMNFNGKGQPAEVWLAPPTFMSVVPSATDYIDHYEFKRNNQITTFKTDEIIHIMTPNPNNPYRGLSEAQALTSVIDSERYAASLQNKIFYNDGRPGFIIEYPAQDMPNSESRKELVQEWDERYKGYRNAGKTAFLWGGKANTLTLSPRDMDFNALRTFSRDSILGAYGVPKSVLGLTEASTFASAKAGNYTFAYYVIHPELCALREAINKELCPFFGDNLIMDFDNPVPEDETMQANNAVNMFKGGIITRNEARVMVELDPLDTPDGEDFFVQPSPLGLNGQDPNTAENGKPEDDSAMDKTPDKETEDKKSLKKKTYNDAEAESIWKAYVTRSETYEKQLITSLDEIFAVTKTQITDKIQAGEKNALINKGDIRKGYTDKATPVLTQCFQDAVKAGRQLIEPVNPHKALPDETPQIINVLNPQALEWLKKRIAWAAEQIGESLAKELNAALLEGFTAGESIPELTKRVMEFFDDKVRSQRIARTETISASSQGAIEGYKESGVCHKVEFWTALDERTCIYCMEYHGKVFNIGEEMPIPLHPNDRCVYLPVID
jgi:HK97 family phage portal protein